MIYDDGPKTSIDEDILNRKDLVDRLSELIMNTDLTESVRIGICGKWGSGKTTVANFVKQRISDDVDCIEFNPWLYSSQNDMTTQFLNLLAYRLLSKRRQWMRRHSRIFTSLADYLESLTGNGFGGLFKSLITLLDNDISGAPITDAKDKISKKLRKENRRIAVFIDDLDRLDPNEIKMVMKLVRTVVDFPNIVYIICYDDIVVEGALGTNVYRGHDFLQKIVNIEIRLPEYNQAIVINELRKEFKTIIGRSELNDYEETLICKFDCIPMSIRDVKLVLSRFRILYDISNNNTCPIDLLALTLIQTKNPETYDWISSNRRLLCGWSLQSIKEMMNEWAEKTYAVDTYDGDGQDPIFKDVLSILFPNFQKNYRDSEEEMIYRINKLEYIDNYFRLTPSSLDFSNETIDFFVNLDSKLFLEVLNGNDPHYISELVNRVCYKIKISKNKHQSKTLSDMCLMQPFGNRTFDIRWVPIIAGIVKTYLRFLDGPDEQISYLESSIPDGDIHKLIIYGALLERARAVVDGRNGSLVIEPVYEKLKQRIISSDVNEINDPIEVMMVLTVISRVSRDQATSLYLELKPSFDERKLLYDELLGSHFDVSFLTNLAGDEYPPHSSRWYS